MTIGVESWWGGKKKTPNKVTGMKRGRKVAEEV